MIKHNLPQWSNLVHQAWSNDLQNKVDMLQRTLPRRVLTQTTSVSYRWRRDLPIARAVTQQDREYINQALALAKKALGQTYPNPAVGCVLVKDGEVIGEGFHPKAGMPHAEVYALRAAGTQAEGATAYVTLEPCNHYGRTPPCSRALVDAKVARVVVGVTDPNPLVGGQGIKTLEAAGIQVELVGGAEEAACYEVNKEFMDRMAQAAAGS